MRTFGAAGLGAGKGIYSGGAVGGTIVVHFIKRNEWFLETTLALLDDEPAPPPTDDDFPWTSPEDKTSSTEGGKKSGGNRVETDLSGKTPLDLSHLDPQPEVDSPPAKLASGWRYETDFSHKTPIDFSRLDGVAETEDPAKPDVGMEDEPEAKLENLEDIDHELAEEPAEGSVGPETIGASGPPADVEAVGGEPSLTSAPVTPIVLSNTPDVGLVLDMSAGAEDDDSDELDTFD
jgi:hypothetical protein